MIKKVVKHSICELRQRGAAWVKVTKKEIRESSRAWAKRVRNKKIWVGEWVQHAREGALLGMSSFPCWEERRVRESLGGTTGLCQDLTCQRCPPPRPLLGSRLGSSDATCALSPPYLSAWRTGKGHSVGILSRVTYLLIYFSNKKPRYFPETCG